MRREVQREVSADDAEGIKFAVKWAEYQLTEWLKLHGEAAVFVGEPRRSLDQSAMFHAMCGEVAKKSQYMGRTLTALQWKVLFVSAHSMATGRGADVVPGLEGEFVNIRESTAVMAKARLSSLIEYVHAWCANNDVELDDKAA